MYTPIRKKLLIALILYMTVNRKLVVGDVRGNAGRHDVVTFSRVKVGDGVSVMQQFFYYGEPHFCTVLQTMQW